jgi:hypothetical protein
MVRSAARELRLHGTFRAVPVLDQRLSLTARKDLRDPAVQWVRKVRYRWPSGLPLRPAKTRDRRPEMRLGGVVKFLDQRMPLERLLDDATLHTLAAAMDQANLAQPCSVRRVDVLLDNGCDVARRERMQVERPLDRNAVCHGVRPRCRWR